VERLYGNQQKRALSTHFCPLSSCCPKCLDTPPVDRPSGGPSRSRSRMRLLVCDGGKNLKWMPLILLLCPVLIATDPTVANRAIDHVDRRYVMSERAISSITIRTRTAGQSSAFWRGSSLATWVRQGDAAQAWQHGFRRL